MVFVPDGSIVIILFVVAACRSIPGVFIPSPGLLGYIVARQSAVRHREKKYS